MAEIRLEREALDTELSREVKALIPRKWNWREMAEKVGLGHEHDYVYSFASKLLHAEPVSITTNQKNLEVAEVYIFMKYIDVKIDEIATLAAEYAIEQKPS